MINFMEQEQLNRTRGDKKLKAIQQNISDEVVLKISNLKGAMIPESRVSTFLPGQEDHVTPYGLIKRAITLYAENFLEVDKQIRELIKSGSLDLKELDNKKQYYRGGMIRILSAVSMLNDDINESETSASNTIFSPTSVKRRVNLKNIDTINDIIATYKEVADRYTTNMSNIDRIEVNGLEESALNLLKENLKKSSEADLLKAKEDFILNLARSALTNFNNISGITYDHKEIEVTYSSEDSETVDLSASRMISNKSYFEYSVVDKDIKPDSGDSVFVVQLLKILEQSFVSKDNIIKVDDITKIGAIFANSFFLPSFEGCRLERSEIFPSGETTSRQYSINELEHHMARHLFLIKSCFPSLESQTFENKIRKAGHRESYNFNCLIENFVSINVERHNINREESRQILGNVKTYLDNFEEKMSSYDKRKIIPTPLHFSELSAKEVAKRMISAESESYKTTIVSDLNSTFNDALDDYSKVSDVKNDAKVNTYSPVKRRLPDEPLLEGEPSTSRNKPLTYVSYPDVTSINTNTKTKE